MKLCEGFVLREIDGEAIVVATGKASEKFNGMMRGNETTARICQLLMTDTTEEAIVDALSGEYAVSRETLEKDVHAVLAKMKEAGMLDA